MAESSNVEGSKPTTVEDLFQLLTTQQRLQLEKFFEMMTTIQLLCKQVFLSDNIKKQLCLKLCRSLKHLILLQNCEQITGPVSLHLRRQVQCLMFELLKVFLTNQTATIYKIDLADAYNQIRLAPESRKRWALSTHRGVLLQNVMPFGISSAPGHFQ